MHSSVGRIAALSLIVLSCADRPGPSSWPSSTPSTQPAPEPTRPPTRPCNAKAGVTAERVSIGGRSRTYTLVMPPTTPATLYPLVMVLHGHGGTGAVARASFDLERLGRAIFVYPDAPGGWDLDSPTPQNPDVALFDAILARATESACVDSRRVFVAGFSNGAYMANQLACRRGDRIRAIASHGGGGPYEAAGGAYDDQGQLLCGGKPVAALIVHGLADGTVSPSEGDKSVEHWTHANHCRGGGAPIAPAGCTALRGCDNGVLSCRVPGLGHHVWPEGRRLTWAFFDAQR